MQGARVSCLLCLFDDAADSFGMILHQVSVLSSKAKFTEETRKRRGRFQPAVCRWGDEVFPR